MSFETDMTGYLMGVLDAPPTAPNATLSLAGPAAVDPLFGVASEPSSTEAVTTSLAVNLTTLASNLDLATSSAALDPFKAKLRCGHFTVVDRKIRFTIGKNTTYTRGKDK